MKQKEQLWVKILRILLACVFLFSGFTKAIDPIASAIQFDDYFTSFGMGFLHPISMFCGVVMNIIEFTLGFMLLFRVKVKFTSVIYLLFMTFFFFLTLWLAVAEHLEVTYGYNFGVVKDCGCFGKAVEMSNMETFVKNIFLMIATLIIFFKRKTIPDIRMTNMGQYLVAGIGVLIAALIQFYCYRNLPVIDFSDWKKGDDIVAAFIEQPAQKELVFVYQNKETGEIRTLDQDEMMEITDEIPDFYDLYDYVDRKDSILVEGVHPEIPGFNMIDESGGEHSAKLINYEDDQILYLLFMPDLDETNLKGLHSENLKKLVEDCQQKNINFVGITNNTPEEIDAFIKENNINFPIYYNAIDPMKGPFMVRDAIRSNPGLILIKKGIVVDKWAWRAINN